MVKISLQLKNLLLINNVLNLILQDTKNKATNTSNSWSKYQSSKSVFEATKAQLKAAEIANEGITLNMTLVILELL